MVTGTITEVDSRIRISVTDDGDGIPDGMKDVVFGRFEQVKNKRQGSTQGSGLGLHISKKLAEQMSGCLYYESEVGVGTTFCLEFEEADVD